MITVIKEAVARSCFPYETRLFAVIALSGVSQCLPVAFRTLFYFSPFRQSKETHKKKRNKKENVEETAITKL